MKSGYPFYLYMYALWLSPAATQMWCFGRLLPLMIGEKIEENNPHWDNFLLLLSIVDYCLAPVISKHWTAYLRMIISDHHEEFKSSILPFA